MALLKQIMRVGTLIALTFLLMLEDPHRFRKSREVGSYPGLQSGRRNSRESEPQLHISKEGDSYLRTLLVQGAQHEALSRVIEELGGSTTVRVSERLQPASAKPTGLSERFWSGYSHRLHARFFIDEKPVGILPAEIGTKV